MKLLRTISLTCCLLPLLWLGASAQPTPAGIADGGNPALENRIEAESTPVAQAAAQVVDSGAAKAAEQTDAAQITDAASAAASGAGAANPSAALLSDAHTEAPHADAGTAEGEEGESSSMQSDPLMIILLAAVAAYLFHLWLQDYRANQAGTPNKGGFPGATAASGKAIVIAVIGALILLAAETGGELALGISAEQSTMTVLMLLSITAAAFFEELIFRGYLVISNKGRALLIGSILGFSVLFAIAHPFLWDITTPEGIPGWQVWNATWEFHFDSTKGWFSTLFVLVNSLWFYAMRFAPFNPTRSLVPCIAAHLAMNWGVFLVKLAQGHVSGLF